MEEYALFASAVEAAGARMGNPSLEIRRLSETGGTIRGSCCGLVETEALDAGQCDHDYFFVFSQPDGALRNPMRLAACLSRLRLENSVVGAVGGAVIAMAKLDLLARERVAIHWRRKVMLAELSSAHEASDKLCETEGQIWTSCGQTSALDLAIHVIADIYGAPLATELAQEFVHSRLYDSKATQHDEVLRAPVTGSPVVNGAIDLFRKDLERPATMKSIARELGVSQRQLEREFDRCCGTSPEKYYRDVRLSFARDLVLKTNLPLLEIALAMGFGCASGMASPYRRKYGDTPSADRRQRSFAAG